MLTKVLEWGRLMSYLEQSTRYIAYNQRLDNGHYRYFRATGAARLAARRPLRRRHGPRCSTPTASCCRGCRPGWPSRFPQQAGDSDFVYRQAVTGQVARRPARPAARRVAVQRRHLRHRPVLRAAAAAHARPPAPRGPPVRRHDARRAAQGDPLVPPAGRRRPTAAASGRTYLGVDPRADVTPRGAPLARPASSHPADGTCVRRRRASRGHAARLRPRRRGEGPGRSLFLATSAAPSARRPAGSRLLAPRRPRGPAARLRGGPAQPPPPARAAPSSAPTTASSSSPTTARSATCSATACSPSSGSVSASRSATTCPSLVADAGLAERYDEAIGRAEELYRTLAPDFPEQAVLRRRAGPPHPLRHADQRPGGDAPDRAALGHPGPSRATAGWPRRCTGPIAEVAGHRALAEAMCLRRPRSDGPRAPRIRAPGRACGGRKNPQRIDQELPRSPWWRWRFTLTAPPPTCLMYGAVPDAPKDAAGGKPPEAARGGCAVRGGGRPWGSSRERVARPGYPRRAGWRQRPQGPPAETLPYLPTETARGDRLHGD